MGKQRSPQQSRATISTDASAGVSKKGVTPPKGRPTRARSWSGSQKRAFGPVAQWVTVGVLVALIVVVLILITDGGDFNPFNEDDDLPSQFGAPATLLLPAA